MPTSYALFSYVSEEQVQKRDRGQKESPRVREKGTTCTYCSLYCYVQSSCVSEMHNIVVKKNKYTLRTSAESKGSENG